MKGLIKYLFVIYSLILLCGNYTYAYKTSNTNSKIILRIDDYGLDNASFYKDLTAVINKNNCPLTISVVPFRHENSGYLQITDSLLDQLKVFCKSNSQIEIALHGYAHQNTMKSGGSGEFVSLSYPEQLTKINEGKKLLESKLGTQIVTFVPPWNSFNAITTNALEKAGFKLISASSYSLFGSSEINTKIKYLPCTVSMVHLMNDATSLDRLVKLSGNNIVVILFHATDFIENQNFYANKSNLYLKSGRKINLAEFDSFLQKLNKTPQVRFLNFKQILKDPSEDLSYRRYLHSRVIVYTNYFWPKTSLDELTYLESTRFNWKRTIFCIYPIIFYFLISAIGFVSSIFITKVLPIRLIKILFNVGIGMILILSGLLFFKISLKIFISVALLVGMTFGLLINRYSANRIKFLDI
jgi:peptidoglycan/xylan/chitin deacetylase (PgdA/CDA1 family)